MKIELREDEKIYLLNRSNRGIEKLNDINRNNYGRHIDLFDHLEHLRLLILENTEITRALLIRISRLQSFLNPNSKHYLKS